ncbi:MAG: Na+/H+ antiporter NhaA [Actinomycetota bacterium]
MPRYVARPLREFLDTEVAGGIVLLAATLLALLWVNSPLGDSYERLWTTELSLNLGNFELSEDLRNWVNDGLMAIFFFVVGLEIKRELVRGELRGARRATLPVIAAVGGMVVPALLYLSLNLGGPGSRGWGIPMATDIAFALGVLALVAPRSPHGLRTFLLSVAIVDDIGAIAVIAIFYSSGINLVSLGIAVGLLGFIYFLRSIRVWWVPIYVVLGAAVWLAVFESGVHATIAGVALGFLAPAHALEPEARRRIPLFEDEEGEAESDSAGELPASVARAAALRVQASTPVIERLEHELHRWTSFVIVPIFALANAGVVLSRDAVGNALGSTVTLGIVLGLVVGKVVGIAGSTWVAARSGIGALPDGVDHAGMLGIAGLAGIGFTVSLFIASLAFEPDGPIDEAKMGILLASVIASAVGGVLLRATRKQRQEEG